MTKIFKKAAYTALALATIAPLAVSAPTTAHAGSRDAFVGGLVGGIVGGAIGSSRRNRDVVYVERRTVYQEPRYVNRGNAHVNWCLNRYRSYSVRTDTYVSYGGRVRYCNSPYN